MGMEAFSLLIDKAVVGGYLSGYKFKGRNKREGLVSYFLLANDTCEERKNREFLIFLFPQNNQSHSIHYIMDLYI